MGVFGVVFGCSGVAGFNGRCLGASIGDGGFTLVCISGRRGDGGFTVATWLCPVREKVRPAWPDGGREREKVRLARSKHPKIGVLCLAGRTFSRKCKWKGCAGRVFSRKRVWRGCAGRAFSRKGRRRGRVGRVLSRTGSRGIPRGELCCAAALVVGPSTGSVNPSIRSYTHLVEAGRGRPTRPQQPTPKRKALIKGSGPPVKAVTSLDNGRKWRVYAGHTLELLR